MRNFFSSTVFIGGALSSVLLPPTPSHSQTALPQVNVEVASPIRRAPSRPTRPASPAPAAPAPAEPAPVAETPQPGTLPIVTDQFATVTVVPSDEIRRNGGGTLGDLLLNKAGITGSSFAPGASSRPIIRGLDVNRVGIVENGVGGTGASDLGEDHFVPIDPLTTNQIEVIRGPATLRYGSQSIGGVVSATDNRIPEAFPDCRTLPSPKGLITKAPSSANGPGCVNFETRSAVSTVDNGLEGGVLMDAASGNFAFHADAFARKADDYRIPSYPYRFEPGQPFSGRQPNSSVRMDGAAVGGSYIFDGGFVGATVIQDNALYHIPGIDGADHLTRIDAHQTRVMAKGEWRAPTTAIDAIRFWAGVTDYKHTEIGLADPSDLSTLGARQT